MLHRNRFEADYSEVFDDYGLATSIWSPLAGELLTGKYLNDPSSEGRMKVINSHFADLAYHHTEWFGPLAIEKTKEKFKALEEIAASLGGSLT